MAAYVYETPNEKAISGALALVMHALFFTMLVLSVNWQKQEPAAMVAELWSNLPSPKSAVPPPPPPPPPKVEPEPPKPEPKVEPKPVPKAEIDLREKKEKERKAREAELADKKKQQQQELAEKKKRDEQEKHAKETADAKRRAQEQAAALKKLAAQQAAQQASAGQDELDKYRQAVAAHIRSKIIAPPNLQGNPEVEFEVIQLPGGEILGVKTRKGSNQAIWDNAVERAILRAQPLPQPRDPALFKDVRELHLKFRPKE